MALHPKEKTEKDRGIMKRPERICPFRAKYINASGLFLVKGVDHTRVFLG